MKVYLKHNLKHIETPKPHTQGCSTNAQVTNKAQITSAELLKVTGGGKAQYKASLNGAGWVRRGRCLVS